MKSVSYVFAVLAMSFGVAQAQSPQNPQNPQSQPAKPQIPPSDSNPGARPANNPATTPPPSMPFDQYDKDTDGSLSRSEFDGAGMKSATFAQVDTNGDGKISRDEWAAHQQPRDQNRR